MSTAAPDVNRISPIAELIASPPGAPVDLEALRSSFKWRLPGFFNIGADVADRHAPTKPAIICTDGRQVTRTVTFGELAESSNRLANAMRAAGVGAGDRVGIVLPQRYETVVAHIAVYKLGAIAVPLSTLFGADALAMRLGDAQVSLVIAESDPIERIRPLDVCDRYVNVDKDWNNLLAQGSPRLDIAATRPDTPAIIIYTSGTTGPPKGALHGHRILLGHLPGVELANNLFPKDGDLSWTPADWAWIGGLFDVLMPSLHHGKPVVAFRAPRFDPEQAFRLMANLGVRNAFFPPTALRMMRDSAGERLPLRSVTSGGEPLNDDLIAWGEERFGLTINEFYGQTEANIVVTNCAALWPVTPGRMGRACPGHEVRIIGDEICVRVEGDPVVFLGYWNNPVATAEKVRDGWLRTGDLGAMDDTGLFRFIGRADDVIASGGYRIGPGEVESCLVKHPAVAFAAVIGAPDALRGQIVKAFVVPAAGVVPDERLVAELQQVVRTELAAYEYPRAIEFVDALPMTTTGKIQRGVLRRRDEDKASGTLPEKRLL